MEVAASIATKLALSGLSLVSNRLAPPLLDKLSSKFGGDVTDEEMQHLNDFVSYEIEALTRVVKSDEKSTKVLEKLQAAALEVEDLLDLYEYNQIKNQVSSSSSSSSSYNCMKEFKRISIDWLRPILLKSPLRIGLEKLLKSVEQVEKLYPLIKLKTETTQPQANTFTPKTSTPSSPFYGRGEQCDMIIKLLLDDSHADLNSRTKNVPIIAIRGLGGAGKTTTAQHVYNENKIVNYFDLRMWVHVTRGFRQHRLIKQIIESAEKNACPWINNLDLLQTKLKDSVLEKKFLLVLDDVWEEDTTRLDIVLSPLNQVGVKGSRIIVTTRTEKAAKDLRAAPIILLDELKDEDCWSILKHHAFDDNNETAEGLEELKYIGNHIISKVKRSPLALKVVGRSLRNKRSANEWEKILQQKDILKDIMDLLLFSYQCLPLHLQRCFAYCSLFPKGYEFNFNVCHWKPHLISLWIAQGFIENTSELTLEEVGQKYIEELLSYSFFEKKSKYSFIIHDLLHDLAEQVSEKQCYRIEHHNSLHDIPTTCIHLSLFMTEKLSSLSISNIFRLRGLRTLIILWVDCSTNIFGNKKDIFQNLTKLRALYVKSDLCTLDVQSDQQMEVLSGYHIDKLKHLRYLHVQCDSKLPASLTKLYHLESFILITDQADNNGCLLANTLPQGFRNLINLHTLYFYSRNDRELDYLYYNSEMINIDKLTSLRNLKKFHPDGFNGIVSLRNLPLRGSLSISNLENVKCKNEAEEAVLHQKKNLNKLVFEWSNTPSRIDTCEEVLEGLEPQQNLGNLEIVGYRGVKFPNWMVKENWLPRLQILNLRSCTCLKIVPFLPPRLERLYVENCGELMQLPPLSDTLRTLYLSNCPKLASPPTFNKSLDHSDMSFLTNLEKLKLEGFLNLQALTNLSRTVTQLTIIDCPKLTSLGNLQRCISLVSLKILRCPMLKREEASLVEEVVEGEITNRLPQVERILTDEPLLVHELVQQQAFGSIKLLELRDCAALPNLKKLSSLKKFTLINCPDVESLPNLPVSLQTIIVRGCPKLKMKYEDGGPLHHTISQLPFIYIS